LTPGVFLGLVPMLLGLAAAQPEAVQQTVSRMVMQDEMILRVPVFPRAPGPRIRWLERKGPNCIPVAAIRRAVLIGPQRVDFILGNRARVRAEFDESCPALDFYGDFYLQPVDRRICAGRDAVHSRMGGSCTIERFKQMVPQIAAQ
jgi:hypothetical protein